MCLAIIIWLYHARTVLPVIYVRVEEGEPEHGRTAADIVACWLLPAIFHPAVYVISVHFLFLFLQLSLPKRASIYCSLLILKEGWRRQRLFSGQFSYQFTAVFKTRKFTPQNCEFNWFEPHKWMFSLRITIQPHASIFFKSIYGNNIFLLYYFYQKQSFLGRFILPKLVKYATRCSWPFQTDRI